MIQNLSSELLKNKILEQIKLLDNIPQLFRKYDDLTLYKQTLEKLRVLLSIIDNLEEEYYKKVQTKLNNFDNTIKILSQAQQK